MARLGSGAAAEPRPRFSRGALLALIAVLVCTALLRARLLDVPLERDEGEFAYMGQLILRGEVPYVAAHNMKLPGVYYGYAAVLAAFGESPAGIHLGLLLINLACIVLVFALGRRLYDDRVGAIAAASFATLSLSPSVLGLAAKGEHFVVLFALAGAVQLAGERTLGRLALAGLWFGIAFVMKQHAALFVAFGGVWVILDGFRREEGAKRRSLEVLAFAAASAVPFLVTCAAMAGLGAFEAFWFWTFTYARAYVSQIPLALGLQQLALRAREIGAASPALWLLALVGLLAPWWHARGAAGRDGPPYANRNSARFVMLFAAFSFLAVCPGLRFSEHYFVLVLPAAALLVGVGVRALAPAPMATLGVAVVAIAISLFTQRDVLFLRGPIEVSRAVYGLNPFPEAMEISRYLRQHARPGDEVAVIGSEPEVYFYSGVRAATSYIYMYPMMEPQPFAREMQRKMIAQLEAERPRFLLFVNVDSSWTRQAESSVEILKWTEDTAAESYSPVVLAELFEGQPTRYRWDEEARAAQPESGVFLLLFERGASPR